MKIIAVVLLFVCLITLMLKTQGVSPLSGFLLWMGGFVTSEVIAYVYTKPRIKGKIVVSR